MQHPVEPVIFPEYLAGLATIRHLSPGDLVRESWGEDWIYEDIEKTQIVKKKLIAPRKRRVQAIYDIKRCTIPIARFMKHSGMGTWTSQAFRIGGIFGQEKFIHLPRQCIEEGTREYHFNSPEQKRDKLPLTVNW